MSYIIDFLEQQIYQNATDKDALLETIRLILLDSPEYGIHLRTAIDLATENLLRDLNAPDAEREFVDKRKIILDNLTALRNAYNLNGGKRRKTRMSRKSQRRQSKKRNK